MTVSQSIITWLCTNPTVDVDTDVSTDFLAAQALAMGLYKTPQANVTQYVNGDRDITAYYNFLLRQRNSQEKKREDNQAWLETLEKWVQAQNIARTLPIMDSGQDCQRVFIANSFYMVNTETNEGVYQLTIGINYIQK